MKLEGRDRYVNDIFTTVAPHIDLLSSLFSFGIADLWRRRLVKLAHFQKSDKVLDLCTGTGKLAILTAGKLGSGGSVTGIDLCSGMLEKARAKSRAAYLPVTFEQQNAKSLPYKNGYFDVVTVAFGMRNIMDTRPALLESHRVLRNNGRFICLELTKPTSRWFRYVYDPYVNILIPLIGGIVTRDREPYSYLPRSIEAFPAPSEFVRSIEQCGFANVSTYRMTLGIATIFLAIRS
ncbi:MAG: bifunctional demethylmenaquinone methyltransferase/2-methoxy-6-polyprenyl-1,4-benzoquinol methylase UbiE [Nitrospirota bacterium]|nr:MAG: bifunctional demethylmenaquinone methyltransferase/2-methoxy-6-polyprenyl-1,4-benzoquinol methylase UbiE [Nitrospirota bacterium]